MSFEDNLKKLLLQEWSDEEKELIDRTLENILSYKRLMSKALKEDILLIVDLCIKLKNDIAKNNSCECDNKHGTL